MNRRFFILFLSVLLLAGACNKKASEKKSFVFKENGSVIGTVKIDGKNVNISYKGKEYSSYYSKDKHKYKVNGIVVYEVKYKDYGFKLRDANGNLLWKIKIYPAEKIKISDNPENMNPYKIKFKDDYYAKVVKTNSDDDTETLMGKVKRKNNVVVFEGTQGSYSVEPNEFHYAFGTLLCPEIPDDQKLIIIAELLLRGY